MKTRRSILSLIFGAAAAPAAVAVAKAMPESEVVGTFQRVAGHRLVMRTVLPPTSWRLLDESDLRYHGVPISIIDEHLQEVLND